jgi:hypothetical protein
MPWQVVCLNCDKRFRITDDEAAAVRQGRARCPGCRQQLLGDNLRERSDGEISASPMPNAMPSKDRQAEAESASEPGEPKLSVKERIKKFLLGEIIVKVGFFWHGKQKCIPRWVLALQLAIGSCVVGGFMACFLTFGPTYLGARITYTVFLLPAVPFAFLFACKSGLMITYGWKHLLVVSRMPWWVKTIEGLLLLVLTVMPVTALCGTILVSALSYVNLCVVPARVLGEFNARMLVMTPYLPPSFPFPFHFYAPDYGLFTETITPQAANILSEYRRDLIFNRIRLLPPEVAKAFVGYDGWELSLDGLTELTPEVAEPLARVKAPLSLGGLGEISPEVAELLAKRNGHLSLDGLVDPPPEVAALIGQSGCGLSLNGLTSVTTDFARALGSSKRRLSLDGLTEITPPVAELLVRSDGELSLNGLKVISPDVAGIFAKHSGGSLHLDGLTSLSPMVARALAEKKKGMFRSVVLRSLIKKLPAS